MRRKLAVGCGNTNKGIAPEPLAEGLARNRAITVQLVDKIFGIPTKPNGQRYWAIMSDDEIVEFARAYCQEGKITKISELEVGPKGDASLCVTLRKRKLLDRVFENKEFEEVTLGGKVFMLPLDKKQERNWSAISDDEVVEYARAYCRENEITKTVGLQKGPNRDTGLCYQLQKRKLMGRVFERKEFEEVTLCGRVFRIQLNAEGNRNWAKMSDDEIVEFARAYCREYGVAKASKLQKGPNKDVGLCQQLQKRKLMGRVFERKEFEEVTLDGRVFRMPLDSKQERNWKAMGDEEILEYVNAYCQTNQILSINDIRNGSNTSRRIYQVLAERKLTYQVFNKKRQEEVAIGEEIFVIPLNQQGKKDWQSMNDEAIVEYARAYCKQNNIRKVSELQEGDPGLYDILKKRNLMNQVFERNKFEEVTLGERVFRIPLDNKQARHWQVMSDEEIVEYAKAYCAEMGITKLSELEYASNKDSGLRTTLERRNLVGKVFERKEYEEVTLDGRVFRMPLNSHAERNWITLTDDEIVAFAIAYCNEYGITRISQLRSGPNKDSGLHDQLQRKKLVNKVFAEIAAAQTDKALAGIADALEKF